MEEEIPIENSPLTAEEELVIANFSQSEQQLVDGTILANCSERWLKVARVAGMSRDALQNYYPALSCSFYAERIAGLVEEGKLVSKGDLSYMRFSEVRLNLYDKNLITK